ncbi:histidinol dehydrogenase [Clostridium folliculivorans]|uniref:Histidinol dehydrogenase n=1 Tax=Clostridium folliculivorans TaxID=2886038 RepID=A0A9W5Y570_9CLOT|nr:histidinol dehydrogenase [Clostridium folliculivorans]GKU26863.1 histidinol dehydrogenase [Clostridium folliculivorans]GKU31514.1 histidinol dehydrogenase [Clostridium folliculivorans]
MIKIYEDNDSIGLFLQLMRRRSEEDSKEALEAVERIISSVRKEGDASVKAFTEKFDGVTLDQLKVSEVEIEDAFNKVSDNIKNALEKAITNIEYFHKKQIRQSWVSTEENGVIMGQKISPLEKVGVYVPGGSAAYPSSVLMNVIPAKLAGVKKIVMVTPPKKDGSIDSNILVAAKLAGVSEIYKVGGAQAIAALAYGTDTIPKVDKIVGPGNIYVALAKRVCYGKVDIDMIAGPSEITIVCDEKANARFLAADLMSQAEHDKLASSVLITTSKTLAEEVNKQINVQIQNLNRKEIIEASLKNYGGILVVKSLEEAIDMANTIAPEHLELMIENPIAYLGKVKNAGSIFLGQYSPEPLGDYMAGPNHVLPTNGTARFFSPLSVDDFIKKSSYIYYTEEALRELSEDIMILAKAEGLDAHGNSIKVRVDNE